jgi:hypothetical protein
LSVGSLRDDFFSWHISKGVRREGETERTERAKHIPDALEHGWLWYLLSHLGFITEPHVDASGWATWVQILCGQKVWVLLNKKGDGNGSKWLSFLEFERTVLDMPTEELSAKFNMCAVVLDPSMQL